MAAQTGILLKEFFYLSMVLQCAPEDSNGLERGMRRIFFFVFNERWLYLFRKAKMDKAPHHRREREEYDPVSEICARVYIVLHLRNGSRGGPFRSCKTNVDF